MKLSGSYQIKLEKQKVWEALNNPEILKKAIPGCEEFIKKSDTEFTATAKNKIGPFNASFTGDIELKNIDAPNSYKIIGSGNSPVGFASGEADVKLEDINNGETNLIYTVEANVGGKIAQVGSRLIDMTAKKMADIFFGKFSDLIAPSSEALVSDATEEKISTSENVKSNKISKKIILYPLAALIIIIVLYNFI